MLPVFGSIPIHRKKSAALNLSKNRENRPQTLERMCYEQSGPLSGRSRPTDNESKHDCNEDRVHNRSSVRFPPSSSSTDPVRDGRCAYQLLAWNLRPTRSQYPDDSSGQRTSPPPRRHTSRPTRTKAPGGKTRNRTSPPSKAR